MHPVDRAVERDPGHAAAFATLGLELRHLRAFVAVAEELHFTRAAQRLFLAQQALSAQIRQLEAMLGEELFARTTRRVRLTAAGEALLEHAPAILALADEAYRSVSAAAARQRSQLRIGYSASVGTVPPIIEALHEQVPDLRVLAQEVSRDEAVEGVRRGRFDVAFVRSAPTEPGLHASLVRSDPLFVTLGERHPLAGRATVRPGELATSVLATWPNELSPAHARLVGEVFARNVAAGRVFEFENASRDGFMRDPTARREILAGRAFCARLVPPGADAPAGFVDRPLDPAVTMELFLVRKVAAPGAEDPPNAELVDVVAALTQGDGGRQHGARPAGPATGSTTADRRLSAALG
jgi:DNA-binding transcriptional LysR family regulator